MTKSRSTKSALISSVVALLLCFTMLLGTTFAWFTDSVTSANNIIKSGNLDIELEYAKVVDGNITAWDTVAGKDNIFDKNALWEPGRVEVVYLKVSNLGTLALKYQLGVNVVNEIAGKNVAGDEFKLSDHLVFKVVEMPDALTTYTDREAVATAAGTEKGLKDYNGKTTALEVGGTDYVALIVYMPESVGNEANYRGDAIPTITLGVNLYATQQVSEEDSFGDDYDAGAYLPVIYTAEELKSALENGENVKLGGDIAVSAPALEVSGYTFAILADSNINGQGNELVDSTNGAVGMYVGDATLIENVVFKSNSQLAVNFQNSDHVVIMKNSDVTGTDAALYFQGAIGGVILENITATADGIADPALAQGVVFATMNYDGTASNVTIKSGTYTATESGAAVVWSFHNSVVTIEGGNFTGLLKTNNGGEIIITGGTFSVDPSAYVASGYKAVEYNGKWIVVADNVDSVAFTAAELATAIANGGVVLVMADIDMANSWTSVKPNGELTILGNGKTITNLNLPLLVGGVSTKVTISGLTVADSNVAPAAYENGLGSAAFIPFVDAYGNVTLENCHVINSSISSNYRAGGLIGYTSGQSLTIKGCSVVGCNISAFKGAAGLVAYSQSVTTIENSFVKDSKLIATEDREGSTPVAGAVIGTVNAATALTNVTASGNTVSNNNATPVFNDCIGRWVSGSLTIDGTNVVKASDQTALNNAISDNTAVNVTLSTGNYTMPSGQGKEITLVGAGSETVLDCSHINQYQELSGSSLVFKNMTVKFQEKGYPYPGLQHTTGVYYENCHIIGTVNLFSDATFKNCTFDSGSAEHNVVTYGAKNITFVDCDFTYGDRSVNVYVDNGTSFVNVSFDNCTFTTENTASKGAVEINSSVFPQGANVSFVDCTAPAYGDMVGISGYDTTGGAYANITVDGAAFTPGSQWSR